MIQIQNARQFTKAAERARRERMFVRPTAAREYVVVNRSKGNAYMVSFTLLNGKRFGSCSCAAGTPCNSTRVPVVCKHLAAAVTVHLALAQMRTT